MRTCARSRRLAPCWCPLVEEGWIDHPVTTEVVRIYLSELLAQADQEDFKPDTLVLGCTHYPLLRRNIEAALPAGIRVIDSAEATADKVARSLGQACPAHRRRRGTSDASSRPTRSPNFRTWVQAFSATPIDKVELVDLGG